MNSKLKKYFRLRAFPNFKDHYEDFIKHNFVALGWPKIGDLTGKSKEEIRNLLITNGYTFPSKQALGLGVSIVS